MATQAPPVVLHSTPTLLTRAFRPFFLAAAVWSAAALLAWVGMLTHGTTIVSRFPPMDWHIHEMLFGFALAAIAGFMLTAIPNWTGRPPLRSWGLLGLVALWLLGRIACLTSAAWPFWLAVAADLLFPAALFVVALREIALARNWRNVVMPFPIAILFVADLLMHLQSGGIAVPANIGWRLGIAAIITLISIIGGRIVPAFTRNWLAKRGEKRLPASHGLADKFALGTLHLGLLGWVLVPQWRAIGVLLLVAGLCNLWRLARWRGVVTLAEPLLAILHVGYLWVAVGAVLLGAHLVAPLAVPLAASVHALTAGAIGTMVLAVMTRVTLGHSGRALTADRVTVGIYVLVTLAAILRVATAFIGGNVFLPLIELSGGLWVAAYVLFLIAYTGKLVQPRADGAPA